MNVSNIWISNSLPHSEVLQSALNQDFEALSRYIEDRFDFSAEWTIIPADTKAKIQVKVFAALRENNAFACKFVLNHLIPSNSDQQIELIDKVVEIVTLHPHEWRPLFKLLFQKLDQLSPEAFRRVNQLLSPRVDLVTRPVFAVESELLSMTRLALFNHNVKVLLSDKAKDWEKLSLTVKFIYGMLFFGRKEEHQQMQLHAAFALDFFYKALLEHISHKVAPTFIEIEGNDKKFRDVFTHFFLRESRQIEPSSVYHLAESAPTLNHPFVWLLAFYCHKTGVWVERDLEKAKKILLEAGRKKDLSALIATALLGCETEPELAASEFLELVDLLLEAGSSTLLPEIQAEIVGRALLSLYEEYFEHLTVQQKEKILQFFVDREALRRRIGANFLEPLVDIQERDTERTVMKLPAYTILCGQYVDLALGEPLFPLEKILTFLSYASLEEDKRDGVSDKLTAAIKKTLDQYLQQGKMAEALTLLVMMGDGAEVAVRYSCLKLMQENWELFQHECKKLENRDGMISLLELSEESFDLANILTAVFFITVFHIRIPQNLIPLVKTLTPKTQLELHYKHLITLDSETEIQLINEKKRKKSSTSPLKKSEVAKK